MIHEPASDNGDSLESAMGMLWEPGYHVSVVHAPPILIREVRTDVSTLKRGNGAEPVIAGRIVVEVMHREDEGVEPVPRETEFDELQRVGGQR